MENITESQNNKAISKLNEGLNTSWDLFLYGDKESGTKPGNLKVYGTIAGQREVLNGRLKLKQELANDSDNEK